MPSNRRRTVATPLGRVNAARSELDRFGPSANTALRDPEADAAPPGPAEGDAVDGYDIQIHALAFGGDGVGRLPDGRATFVRGAVPGDRLRVRLCEEHRSFARADIVAVLAPGPQRIAPPCPLAGTCGGCSWQQLDLAAQREWKRRLIALELARRVPGFAPDTLPPPWAGASFGHRTRTRLHRRGTQFGTLAARSHAVLPFGACPVLAPPLADFARELARGLADLPPGDADLELYVDATGARGLFVRPGQRAPLARVDALAAALRVQALAVAGAPAEATPAARLAEISAGQPLAFGPGVFVQTNREANAALVAAVVAAAGAGERFAELYAGIGNFTVHLARRFAGGLAAEGDPRAAAWLAENTAGLPVAVRAESDVQTAALLAVEPAPDAVVLDPPRAGIRALRPLWSARAPARVVLVSCDPAAALRDIAHLVGDVGYRLGDVQLFDLFPQTHHVEMVATLDRRAAGAAGG